MISISLLFTWLPILEFFLIGIGLTLILKEDFLDEVADSLRDGISDLRSVLTFNFCKPLFENNPNVNSLYGLSEKPKASELKKIANILLQKQI